MMGLVGFIFIGLSLLSIVGFIAYVTAKGDPDGHNDPW